MEALGEKISAKITDLAKTNQVTVIGDTDHADPTLAKSLFSVSTMQALKAGGVSHVFLEFPPSSQTHADEYQQGTISKDQFLQNMSQSFKSFHDNGDSTERFKSVADMIDYGRGNGMKIHFADVVGIPVDDNSTEPLPEIQNMLSRAATLTLEEVGAPKSNILMVNMIRAESHAEQYKQNILEVYNGLPVEEQTKISGAMNEMFLKEMENRLSPENDAKIADHVISVAGDQKAAVIYGSFHDGLTSAFKTLGHSAGNIDIYSGKEANQGDLDRFNKRYDNVGYLDTDTVEAGKHEAGPLKLRPVPAPNTAALSF